MHPDLPDQLLDELRWLRGLAVALAGGDAQLAEDLVQDGAVALLEQRGPVRSIRAWLATVVRRRAVALRGKKAQSLEAEPASSDDGQNGHEVAARLEAQQQLNAAVLALADPYRAVVVGHHLDGVSLADLARQRGVSAATVRQQHRRALEMLRQRLDQGACAQGWQAAIAPLLVAPTVLKTGSGVAATAAAATAATTATATVGGILMVKKLLAAVAVIVCAWWGLSLTNTELAPPSTTLPGDTPLAAAAAMGELPGGQPIGAEDDPQRQSAGPALVASAAEQLVLSVRGSGGQALAGAVVHCGPSGNVSRFGKTDQGGVLRLEGWQQAGEVWVWARNRAPFRESIPELRGQHRVVLPDGPVVEGLITVDGKPPGEPVVLSVHWRDEAPRPALPGAWSGQGDRQAELSAAVAFDTRWGGWLHPDYDWRATVVTEPSGRFALRGANREHLGKVGIGWTGWAGLGPYRLMDAEGKPTPATYRVPDATQPIHIDLLRAPSLRATFVFPDGEPVGASRLQVRVVLSNGKRKNHEGGQTDLLGRIDRALFPSDTGGPDNWWREDPNSPSPNSPSPDSLSPNSPSPNTPTPDSIILRISHPDAAPVPLRWTRTALRECTRGRLIDLGEVTVPRIHRMVVQVVDPDGQPVAGIQALLQDDLSEPTDPGGRTTIELAARTLDSLWVAGPGWSTQEARKLGGRGTDDDPLRLRLQHPSSQLIVTVPEGFSGDELHKLRFGLESNEPMFPATRYPNQKRAWGPTALHQAAGGSELRSWSSGSASAPARVSCEVSEGRELVLVGIAPGLPVTAWLEDHAGQRILEQKGRAPDWGEQARIELQGEPSHSTHTVRVQLGGRPPEEGTVYCQIPGERDVRVRLDDSGQGELRLHASGAAVELFAAAKGAFLQRLPIQLTAGTHRVEVALQPANQLTVALVDRDGAPVSGILHLDSGPKPPWGIRELLGSMKPATRHVLGNAPPGPAAVVVHLGGRTFRRTVQRPLDGSDARLVVPRPVSLALHLPNGTIGQSIELRWRPEGGLVGETNTHTFTFSRSGWQPATIDLLPGRYHYTLHRRWRDEVTAQGVANVQQDSEQLRLNVAIPSGG